ncbi:MAG TPA: DUF3616 domain-containing protein [Blastocatellia bacterium]|nr:DUF3616 domain-containing protein [Blastocatellia bacterium]
MNIRIKEDSPENEPKASAGSTEALGSQTIDVAGLAPTPTFSAATLRVLLPTGDVFDKEIHSPEVQLGKGPRNDIVLSDPAVSTAHAAIKYDGRTYTITDLGSRNGTYVNSERIEGSRELKHGDVIGMGLSKLTFRIGGYSETGTVQMANLALDLAKPVRVAPSEKALAEALVAEGLLAKAEVDQLTANRTNGRRLTRALIEEGRLNELALQDLMSRSFGLPKIDLRTSPIDDSVAVGFSSELARKHRVFAYGKQAGALLLAMADPTDTAVISEVEREFKSPVMPGVATFSDVAELIEKYYGPKLIGVLPTGENLRFLIDQPEIAIGKASHNHIVLSDPTVSNTHAVVLGREGGYCIVDLGSRNGSFVNGERLGTEARLLHHGDSIQLGQTVLTFRNSFEMTHNMTQDLSAEALEEMRGRAHTMGHSALEPVVVPGAVARGAVAGAVVAGAAQPGDVITVEAETEEDKKKKKKKKKKTGKDERLRAAYVSGLSRILAQVLGVVLAVVLALYVNSSLRSGSDKPIVEPSAKGKAKMKLAKPGEGSEFTGGVFEASGVVQGPASDGVYFIDDSKPGQILFLPLDQSGHQNGEIKPIDFGASAADPEGITYGGSFFYIVGSQSHKSAGERNALIRFALDPSTQTVQGQAEVVSDLRSFLLANVAELQPYAETKGNEGGVNIEGLSWDPENDRLLLGMRAPVIDGKALVIPLKLKNPRGEFNADNLSAGPAIKISLGGQGIRDLQYDARGGTFLVISGAQTQGETKNFALWEWPANANGTDAEPKELTKLDSGMKPEGVTRVKAGGRDFLFVVGDGSRYLKLELSDQ